MLLGAFTSQGAGVSSRSESFSDLLSAVHEAAAWRREDHPYSSVMVSMELSTGPHKDARNDGYNSVLVLGDYQGGEVLAEDPRGNLTMSIEGVEVPANKRSRREEWFYFDASKYHEGQSSTGARLSVALFLCKGLHRLSEEHWSRLCVLGFDVPRLRAVAEEQKGESVENGEGTGHRGPKTTDKSTIPPFLITGRSKIFLT
eukprot:1267844-Amphidinium_carterae.1